MPPSALLNASTTVCLFAMAVLMGQAPPQAPVEQGVAQAQANSPLFVANQGQWPSPAAFRIRSAGATARLEPDGMAIDLQRAETSYPTTFDGPGACEPTSTTTASARLSFVNAGSSRPVGEEMHPARAHFYLGNDPAAWRHDVPMFQAVRWSQAWPGIDVRAHAQPGALLEFELEVAAGVDPRTAVLCWDGVEKIERQADGALRLLTAAGPLLQSAPIAWQPMADGAKLPVGVAIELLEGGSFRFLVEGVRPDLPVVIDPVLSYHGSSGNEVAHGVARDAAGRTVVAGFTNSPLWVSGAPTAGGEDVFVSCFDFTQPLATQLVWTTTVGGNLNDRAFDVDVDVAGFVTVVGGTSSSNFPTPGGLQPGFGGILDGFVLQLTAGGAMNFATYHGGPGNDWCCRVEMDAQLYATVGGYSDSTTLPAVNAFQPTNAGLRDAFVVRYAPFGTALVYSTYLGGAGNSGILTAPFGGDSRVLGLDLDAAGRVLLTGLTTSANFPVTANALQPGLGGGADAFVTILDPSQQPANQLSYSTYLGRGSSEGGMAARFGPGNTVVVGGYTYSSSFPTTTGAFHPTFVGPAGFNDAFLVFLDLSQPPATQLTYGTFFGGTSTTGPDHYDSVEGLSVDGRRHATVVGFCCGNTWLPPHVGAFQPVHGGDRDGFVARLRPLLNGANDLTYGTYLGGLVNDLIYDAEPEPDGGAAIAGRAMSAGIPGPSGGLLGVGDALVGTFEVLPAGVTRGLGSSPYCAGTPGEGTVMLEVDRQPAAGLPFSFLIGGTPPGTFGFLGLNFGPPGPPVPFLGALLCLSLAPPPFLQLFVSPPPPVILVVPPGWPIPLGIHAQVVWFAPTCTPPSGLLFTSSATLSL